jgi:hypothetical protein
VRIGTPHKNLSRLHDIVLQTLVKTERSAGRQTPSTGYDSYGGPPMGATTQCADGTYSFSQHRSGNLLPSRRHGLLGSSAKSGAS